MLLSYFHNFHLPYILFHSHNKFYQRLIVYLNQKGHPILWYIYIPFYFQYCSHQIQSDYSYHFDSTYPESLSLLHTLHKFGQSFHQTSDNCKYKYHCHNATFFLLRLLPQFVHNFHPLDLLSRPGLRW